MRPITFRCVIAASGAPKQITLERALAALKPLFEDPARSGNPAKI